MNNKIVLISVVLTTLLLHCAAKAQAQSIAVSLQPALQIVYAKPGTSVQIPVVIKNTDSPTSYVLKAVRLTPKGSHGDLEPHSDLPRGINVQIPETEAQFLGIGAEKKTSLSITIDKTVSQQDYYIGLVVESVGKKHSEGKSSLAITVRTISTVLLTVTSTGSLQNSGYIHSFVIDTTNVKLFDSQDQIPLNVMVGNSGTNWTYFSGTVTVYDSFGNHEQFSIPKQRVLANTKYLLRSSHTNTPDRSLVLDGFHVGKYSAKVQLVIEGKSGIQTRTTTFIALPYKLIVFLSGIAIVTGVVVSKINRPRRAHPIADSAPHRL